jgi:hypothetical protein
MWVGPTATTADARSLVTAQRPKLAIVDVNLKTSCGLIDELHELRSAAGIPKKHGSIPAKTVQ